MKREGLAVSCMKCGREIGENQVFCDICLADMKKHPVKPGIAVQLPHRKETHTVKKAAPRRKQAPAPEERILRLKKRLRRMVFLWIITLLLLAATIYPTIQYVQDHFSLRPGQNYTTFTDSSFPEP